ncbi:MAG: hypothetical protein AB1782_19010 [Cyanobacteriota bacterium]
MSINAKKHLIIMLSFIVSFTGACSYNYADNNNNTSSNMSNTLKKSTIDKLAVNPNWQKVSNTWKNFNKLEYIKDYNKLTDEFNNLEKEMNIALIKLEQLEKARLITTEEQNYISLLFKDRMNHLQGSFGMYTCYQPTMDGGKIVNTKQDLENRYDIIEKLFKEKKINSETFTKTRRQIIEDLKVLEKSDYTLKKKQINANLIDLIINLNK